MAGLRALGRWIAIVGSLLALVCSCGREAERARDEALAQAARAKAMLEATRLEGERLDALRARDRLSTAEVESAPTAPTDRPYVLVLGTAQDGGLPQLGCRRACCVAAREDPSRRRSVTSLLLVDPRARRRWLIDASPDIDRQLEVAVDHPRGWSPPAAQGGRPPLFDGILLTHAHTGHYAGLLPLGREAYGAAGQRLYATESMQAFLTDNGPWSLSVAGGGFDFARIDPEHPLRAGEDLVVEALRVPHRDEFSDTLAFVIRGPERSLLYLPDIDKWERWETPVEEVLAGVDVALVDGTFFGPDELPGRAMAEIPHPFIFESLERFAPLSETDRAKLRFTHLNHSNPAADPASDAARQVRDAGCSIAQDGELHAL
ncbi:MBL fold metallo-hydrolase [Engelhardtia mirabilis]|uniref:Coenzyme PQQ synthesis protein B n=1 Tax=Engelhardtia mirabilis TaxID=2528011 RepID=A0A518BIR5_9BACT|nr:Coenzyme PQQ synthesis protein B [Planctomycetes bacterium Pla133]QDV01195.1 Coenzyme PQQ synthesis protein B [Planctomycetes bacterium Pla86]